jgi:hypothetical protein
MNKIDTSPAALRALADACKRCYPSLSSTEHLCALLLAVAEELEKLEAALVRQAGALKTFQSTNLAIALERVPEELKAKVERAEKEVAEVKAANSILTDEVEAEFERGRQVGMAEALRAVADELEILRRDGPQIAGRFTLDGEPVMCSMREALRDYENAAAAEAAEVDRLNAVADEKAKMHPPLPFIIEARAGVMVLEWSDSGECRPASAEEIIMWHATQINRQALQK